MIKMERYCPKLDILSENIIYLLSLDSRITINKLSDQLGESRKIVENRVSKLYEKKYVKPLLIYNHYGLIKATVLIKLSIFNKKIIESIKNIPHVIKLKETLGDYDLSLLVMVNSKSKLDDILLKINELYHQHIQNIDIIISEKEDTLGYKSFCHDPKLLGNYSTLDYDKSYKLKKEEDKLIDLLKNNPLISYKDLIKKTGLGYKRIKEHIDTLLKHNIIRFSIDPDYELMGLEFHNILVKINPSKSEQFENFVINHPRMHWLKKGIGRWDYIISITTRNINEFIEITQEIRGKNQDIIFEFSPLISKVNILRKI